MSRILTVLAIQGRGVAFDPAGSLGKLEGEVERVAEHFPHADLLIFPELYVTGDDPFTGREPPGFPEAVAEPIPGPLTERLGLLAAQAGRWLVAGSLFERGPEGAVHNTAVVFGPDGSLVARHRKLFPWRPWERTTPGEGGTVFEVPGAGTIGLMTCYEGWFPETARGLCLQGAELIVQPSLTTTADREEEIVMARANAIANQCFVVNVNAASTIGGGRSVGVDPEGRVLFLGGPGEEIILEVIDLDRTRVVRERGTRGLNRVWQHFLQAPRAVFEPYERFLDKR